MKLPEIFRINFIKNSSIVFFGTIFSYVISFISIPLITKFYSPEVYGLFSVFFGLITTLSSISLLRLDVGLIRGSTEDSSEIIRSSKFVLKVFTLSVLSVSLVLVLFEIVDKIYVFTSPVIYFLGYSLLMGSWFNKTKKYKTLTSNNIIKTSSKSILEITLGFIGFINYGLFFSLLLSSIVSFFHFKRKFILDKTIVTSEILLNVYQKNKNLILFNVSNVLVDSLRGFIFLLLITRFFGLEQTGLYVFSNKIISVPFSLLSVSLGKVFFETISNNISLIKTTVNKYFLGILLISIIMCLTIIFSLNLIFDYFINESYFESKKIILYLLPWVLLTFLSHPFSYVLTITHKEKTSLLYSLTYSMISLSVLYLNKNDFLSFVENFSFVMSLFLLIYILMNLIYINRYVQKNY
jgi:lipopolysaccharide exporter